MKEVLVNREMLRERRLELLKAVLNRVIHEEEGPATDNVSEFRRGDSAEVIQLENPKGGERWEIILSLDETIVFLRQLYYSGAGGTYQAGKIFSFLTDEMSGQEAVVIPTADEPFLADDQYFTGLSRAVTDWPVAKWYVAPLEEKV